MANKPKILQRKIVTKSQIFTIEAIDLQFSNGNERTFERLVSRSNGAVVIVPFIDDETFLLVKEYAAGVDRYELTFPKGIVDPGEDTAVAANRELMEEVGYAARTLIPLTKMTTAPGYWGSSAEIFLARDLYPEKAIGDEPEELEVIPWRLADYRSLLAREDFTEARNIAVLFWLKEMFAL